MWRRCSELVSASTAPSIMSNTLIEVCDRTSLWLARAVHSGSPPARGGNPALTAAMHFRRYVVQVRHESLDQRRRFGITTDAQTDLAYEVLPAQGNACKKAGFELQRDQHLRCNRDAVAAHDEGPYCRHRIRHHAIDRPRHVLGSE